MSRLDSGRVVVAGFVYICSSMEMEENGLRSIHDSAVFLSIYMCACVCVCVFSLQLENGGKNKSVSVFVQRRTCVAVS